MNGNHRNNVKKTFPLHKAIQYCNLRKVEILAQSQNLNQVNDAGEPAFVLACKQETGNKILEFLLTLNFDPTLVDGNNFTALHVLALRGKLKWIDVLFQKFPGLEVDPRTDKENTPLILAAKMNHHNVIKFLHRRGADVNAKNNKGYTALLYAANNGYEKSTGTLINLGAEINEKENYDNVPLMKACSWGFEKTAKVLLDNGAKVNLQNAIAETPLYLAVRSRNYDLVKLLLENDAKVNYKVNVGTKNPLNTACYLNCVDIMDLLIDYGADVNYPGTYSDALLSCVKGKSYKCAKALMKLHVNVHGKGPRGLNALAYAKNDPEMRNILLNKH